jgi:Ca2+-binding EF-hand superfamily protein
MQKIIVALYDLHGIKDRKGANEPKQRVAEIFARMDKNYSNTLDRNEFIEGCLSDPVLLKFLNPQV